MKKIVIFIVLVCYLAVSTGVIINFHYCMNRLASMELFAPESKRCDKCGMHLHKSHGCCRDEVKIIKMEDDQKITSAIFFELSSPDALYFPPSVFIAASFYNVPGKRHYHNHSPPLLATQDICVQHCIFRI